MGDDDLGWSPKLATWFRKEVPSEPITLLCSIKELNMAHAPPSMPSTLGDIVGYSMSDANNDVFGALIG